MAMAGPARWRATSSCSGQACSAMSALLPLRQVLEILAAVSLQVRRRGAAAETQQPAPPRQVGPARRQHRGDRCACAGGRAQGLLEPGFRLRSRQECMCSCSARAWCPPRLCPTCTCASPLGRAAEAWHPLSTSASRVLSTSAASLCTRAASEATADLRVFQLPLAPRIYSSCTCAYADNDLLDTAKREATEELGQLPHFQLKGEILTKCALNGTL